MSSPFRFPVTNFFRTYIQNVPTVILKNCGCLDSADFSRTEFNADLGALAYQEKVFYTTVSLRHRYELMNSSSRIRHGGCGVTILELLVSVSFPSNGQGWDLLGQVRKTAVSILCIVAAIKLLQVITMPSVHYEAEPTKHTVVDCFQNPVQPSDSTRNERKSRVQ